MARSKRVSDNDGGPDRLDLPAGLRGVKVADTSVGAVRGDLGFFHYREHDATALANKSGFEAITCLLIDGELPTESGAGDFATELGSRRVLPPALLEVVDHVVAAGAEPMLTLRCAIDLVGDGTPTLDQDPTQRRTTALEIIGATPTILARAHRRRIGREPVDPDPTLTHAADYVRMVTGAPSATALNTAVERYLCLTADHGFNASTFAARVIASTGASIASSIVGALGALSGPLHGGAPSRVLDMIDAIGEPESTEAWIEHRLSVGDKIMGFGHAVYQTTDPRSDLLKQTAIEIGGDLAERAVEIEGRALAALRAAKPDAQIATNVEFYAAVVLSLAGLPQDMFTPTFSVSRVVGWSAHVLEQANDNRIIRPSARYRGPIPERLLVGSS